MIVDQPMKMHVKSFLFSAWAFYFQPEISFPLLHSRIMADDLFLCRTYELGYWCIFTSITVRFTFTLLLVLANWGSCYHPGPNKWWTLDRGRAWCIRGWSAVLPSPHICILVHTYCLWVAPRVGQGLDAPSSTFVWYSCFLLLVWSPHRSRIMLQVVALDIDLPVKQAFHILHEQACLSPLFILFSTGMVWLVGN